MNKLIKYLKSHYNLVSTVTFVAIIILAQIFATDNYSFLNNTISDLGAQGYSMKPIMQVGFVLFGAIIALGIFLNGLKWRTLPILIYGLSILLTGVFCTRPFFSEPGLVFSESQSNFHSFFAQTAGVAFSIGILLQMFYSTIKKEKIVHLVFFLLVIGISSLFGLSGNYQGIIQRLLYTVSFIWFIWFYKVDLVTMPRK